MKSSELRAAILPAVPGIFVALWATGFIGARYAMPHAEPFLFLGTRFAIAGVLIALAAAWARAPWPCSKDASVSAFIGMLIHGGYLGGIFWAVRNGMPAGLSALIIGLQPVITAIIARGILGEPVHARTFAGLAIGFCGVALVMIPSLQGVEHAASLATYAACFLSVLAISLGTVLQKKLATDTDLLTGTFWQYAGACLVMAAASVATEHGEFQITGELVFAMAWLVFVLSLGAIFLLMWLIRQGAVSKVATLFYLVPGVTAIIAWLLFDERLSLLQIAGLVVAAAGVRLATGGGQTRPRTPR